MCLTANERHVVIISLQKKKLALLEIYLHCYFSPSVGGVPPLVHIVICRRCFIPYIDIVIHPLFLYHLNSFIRCFQVRPTCPSLHYQRTSPSCPVELSLRSSWSQAGGWVGSSYTTEMTAFPVKFPRVLAAWHGSFLDLALWFKLRCLTYLGHLSLIMMQTSLSSIGMPR